MLTLTNSIFTAMLKCPARAMAMYKGRILGDPTITPEWQDAPTEAMACGSLVDAMVTRGMIADENDKKVTPPSFHTFLKSSYDDGTRNAALLCNKSGGWNAAAKTAILSAKRLLADPTTQRILQNAILQPRISFPVGDGVTWQGDIDILTAIDGELHIIDLKSPGKTEEGWITSDGKNTKCKWHEKWSYWFQLSGYRYGIESIECAFTVNGAPWKLSALPELAPLHAVHTGLIYCSRETHPEIGYVPIPNLADTWEAILTEPTKFGGRSKLDAIKAIASGTDNAPMCGTCDYCKSKSSVTIDQPPIDQPPFDDIYGLADIQ